MMLRNLALAAVMATMPVAASAVTFDPSNNIAPGSSNPLSGAPYFFEASFNDDDEGGTFDFTFDNVMLGQSAVTISAGTVLQNTLDFLGGVTVSWLNAGLSDFIPEGVAQDGFTLTSLIGVGESDTLRIVFGDPEETTAGGRGNIDFNIKVEPVQPIPLPASIMMLFGALGGLAFLGRRRAV